MARSFPGANSRSTARLYRYRGKGGHGTGDLVARCWDLDSLDRRYGNFSTRWQPTLDEVRADPESVEPARCFALRFNLIHEFRRFPLEDPFLPRSLLPSPWAGDHATDVFLELHDRLVGRADAHVESVLAQAPEIPILHAP